MRGEYSTRQKRELLAFLEERGLGHFTVDEVVFAMQGRGERVGRSTVYRYLETLAAQGSVRKYQDTQGVTQYQHVTDDMACDAHFHMLCKRCGSLMHVDCERMGGIAEHLMRAHGFELDPRETVLVGLCAACRGGGEEADGNGADCHEGCDHCL